MSDLSSDSLLAFAVAEGQVLPSTKAPTKQAPRRAKRSAKGQHRIERPTTTHDDYAGNKRYLAHIKDRGYIKVDKTGGIEDIRLVKKTLTATRFATKEEAKEVARAWGKLYNPMFLRSDVTVLERTLL